MSDEKRIEVRLVFNKESLCYELMTDNGDFISGIKSLVLTEDVTSCLPIATVEIILTK
jgi:hypothetical protein